jgi:hypothetical protein
MTGEEAIEAIHNNLETLLKAQLSLAWFEKEYRRVPRYSMKLLDFSLPRSLLRMSQKTIPTFSVILRFAQNDRRKTPIFSVSF